VRAQRIPACPGQGAERRRDCGIVEAAVPGPDDAIVLEDVSKAFGSLKVLDGITLTVKKGSITVLLGPSGTGKSVLLRILVGLMQPDSGRVYVGDTDIAALDERRRRDRERLFVVRRKFGMLFQDGALFDDMNVRENVAFPMRMHTKMREEEIRAKVADKLARVGLPGAEHKFPSELSGGMRKRVAFARAIALEPEIVLCDEPSSGLDPVMSATLDELIMEMHRSLGISFIVISHDTAEALTIADTIGMLARGKLVHFGPRADLDNECHPALRQFFDRSTDGPIQVV
jgi:phospholipid/cholesterol/gamma-HCH transport system ATP-binding protein